MDKRIEELKATVRADAARMEKELDAYLTSNDKDIDLIFEAQRYAVLDGGKRIRPFIVNEFCRLFGGSDETSMAYACAIEIIPLFTTIVLVWTTTIFAEDVRALTRRLVTRPLFLRATRF